MLDHIKKYKLIKETQHGFVENRSCLTNLLAFLEYVSDYVDQGYPIDVIHLDFQKAFDKVPHRRIWGRYPQAGPLYPQPKICHCQRR